jgi:hypothetical protein
LPKKAGKLLFNTRRRELRYADLENGAASLDNPANSAQRIAKGVLLVRIHGQRFDNIL